MYVLISCLVCLDHKDLRRQKKCIDSLLVNRERHGRHSITRYGRGKPLLQQQAVSVSTEDSCCGVYADRARDGAQTYQHILLLTTAKKKSLHIAPVR